MNPCPCGFYPDRNKCKCSEAMIERYQKGISKPILERIDICAESSTIKFEEMTSNIKNEDSKTIRERIVKARKIQKDRFKNYEKINFNSQMGTNEIKKFCMLEKNETNLLKEIFRVKKLSSRTYHKILKVARIIADLNNKKIEREHLIEASNYRGLEEHIYV